MEIILNFQENQKDQQDAVQYIQESGVFKILNATLHERKTFANAAASGLAVTEMKPRNPKAIKELSILVDEISNLEIKKRKVA